MEINVLLGEKVQEPEFSAFKLQVYGVVDLRSKRLAKRLLVGERLEMVVVVEPEPEIVVGFVSVCLDEHLGWEISDEITGQEHEVGS